MARTFIGHDYTGTACLKVTRNSADDPKTTPDADRHKFAYNSKDHKVAEIAAVKVPTFDFTPGANWVFEGGAGTSSDFVEAHWGDGTPGGPENVFMSVFSEAAFPDLDYYCPLVDYKYKDSSGKGVDLVYWGSGAGLSSGGGTDAIGGRPNTWLGGSAYTGGGYSGAINGGEIHYLMATGYTGYYPNTGYGRLHLLDQTKIKLPFFEGYWTKSYGGSMAAIVWNLPGDNTPLLQEAPGTPVSGQQTIDIKEASFKIAKPGFDVSSATKQQLAFSAEKRPVKVIASGDILLPSGVTTTHNIGFAVDASVYLDVQYYPDGGEIVYPASPAVSLYGAKYYVSGSTIYFENAGAECRARFIVIAVDALGPSTGSNKVFQVFEEGGERVVRILAPGAADPPRLSDIVVDSRWPTLPILAEGYVSITGVQTHTINFTNPGLRPFVKLAVLRSYGGRTISMPPVVRRLRRTGWPYNIAGDTVFATVASSGTQITISAFRGNPMNAFMSSGGVTTWYMPTVIGVRYYVFGIPED